MRQQLLTLFLIICTVSFSQDHSFENNGIAYYNEYAYDTALYHFKKCSDHSIRCKHYVAICNAQLKNYNSAISEYKKLRSNINSDSSLFFIDYDIGLCYSHLNQYDSAIHYFQKQINRSPHCDSYYMLGNSFTQLWLVDSALNYLHLAEQIKPSDTLVIYNLAYANYMKADYSEALKYYTLLLSNRPSTIELNRVHYIRGKIFYELKLLSDALSEFNTSIQLGYSLSRKDSKLKKKIERKLNKT